MRYNVPYSGIIAPLVLKSAARRAIRMLTDGRAILAVRILNPVTIYGIATVTSEQQADARTSFEGCVAAWIHQSGLTRAGLHTHGHCSVLTELF